MKRRAQTAAAQRETSRYHLRLVQDAAWLDLAKYALGSAGAVLSAGVIVVASGAAISTGAARNQARTILPSLQALIAGDSRDQIYRLGNDAAPDTMLIAQDPGPELWARLVSGESPAIDPSAVDVRPLALALQNMTVPSLQLRAITTQKWPIGLAATPSFFALPPTSQGQGASGPLADDPAASDPPAAFAGPGQPGPKDTGTAPEQNPTSPVTSSAPPLPSRNPVIFRPAPSGLPSPPASGESPPFPPSGPVVGGPAGAVPEPSTWTSFILGFGLIGSAIRRARRPAAGRA